MFFLKGPFGFPKGPFFILRTGKIPPLKKLEVFLGFLFLVFSPAALWADDFSQQLGEWLDAGQFAPAEDALQEKLEQNPDQPTLWLELGALKQTQGDNAAALAAYQSSLSRRSSFAVQLAYANTLLRLARLPESKAAFLQLNSQQPNNGEVLWGLAQVCLYEYEWTKHLTFESRQAPLAEAQQWLLKTTKAEPLRALAFWDLAEVSRLLGDRGTALSAYQTTLKLDGSFKQAHLALARLLARDQKYPESLAQYEQAMAIDPKNLDLKKEAHEAARLVPSQAAAMKQERYERWEEWTPPDTSFMPSSPVTIRVGIATGMGRLRIKCLADLTVTTPANTPITVLPGGHEYRVVYLSAKKSPTHAELWQIQTKNSKTLVTFSNRIWFTSANPQKSIGLHAIVSNSGYFFARESDRAYREIIEIYPKAGQGFQVINRISLEAYLAGVIPSEMQSSWPMEALEAQAIVARTYALSKMGQYESQGFDVSDNVSSQVYGGLRAEDDRTNAAVIQTAGQVLKNNGRILPVAFSAQCGGHTQDYEEAWGADVPVIGVKDYEPSDNQDMDFPLSPYQLETWIHESRPSYCNIPSLRGYQNYRWVTVISAADLAKKSGPIGRVRRLVVEHRSGAGWADHLLVEGENGNKELKGDLIRSFLGGIRSNLIWIETQLNPKGWPEAFIIYGGGWGHGVGLCQVGTLGLAQRGKSVEDILRHYFPEGSLEKLN